MLHYYALPVIFQWFGGGTASDDSLGKYVEQQISSFSSPHSSISLGHTSTPNSSNRSRHQGVPGHCSKQCYRFWTATKLLKKQQDMVESHLAELQSKVEESATSTQVVMEKGRRLLHEPCQLVHLHYTFDCLCCSFD